MPTATRIVLLPGLDGTGRLFDRFVETAPDAFDPLVVRYPRDRPLDYDQLEERVLSILPRDEPYILLGESFSGPLSLRLAARPLPGLRALVLAATFATRPGNGWARFFPLRPVFSIPPPLPILHWYLAGGFEESARAACAAVRDVSAEVLAHRVRCALRVDARPQLRSTEVPVIALVAAKDRLIPRRCSDEFRSVRPSTSVVLLDGPHMILHTRPREAWAAISASYTR